MIVYVKNSNGVRQLEEIDDVALDNNIIYGMSCFENWDGRFIWDREWTIKPKNGFSLTVCYDKIKQALNSHKDSILLHIHDDEGVIIK